MDQYPDGARKCEATRRCVIEHEATHIRDAARAGQLNCTQNPFSPNYWRSGWLGADPNNWMNGLNEFQITELNAHAAQLLCLARALKVPCLRQGCKIELLREIRVVANNYQYILDGSYGGF
jgi:hypothetical protein